MKYSISFRNPLTHFIHVELELDTSQVDIISLALPIWRPGRYEAANYAKNIRGFKAISSGNSLLPYRKISHSMWELDTRATDKVMVSYDYFAFKMDAGNSWYDEELIYINFINCMLYDIQQLNEACQVFIDIPDNYSIACGLKRQRKTFVADNYYELVDSPLLASAEVEHIEYSAGNVQFHIWLNGRHPLDRDQITKAFRKFSDKQVEMMGEFPEEEYHFLFHLLPYKLYHGVEHHDSTVICLGPAEALNDEDLYSQFLGVSSHELFHAWNIIRIRPKEIMPYEFHKPVTFPTGFVAEGFTTYYGDLFLVRSGVFDRDWYFNELNVLFKRHFSNFGRLNYSVVDSSVDLWIDGYSVSAPERKSSIYVEGAMVALCLDLMIRESTTNKYSLDDVMRELWLHYGKQNIGYTFDDIQALCEKYYGNSLAEFFKEHVTGLASKEDLISELLNSVGCQLMKSEAESSLEKYFGLRLSDNNGGLRVSQIAPGSIGERHFSLNDEILTINNEEASMEKINSYDSSSYVFMIRRNYKDLEINITPGTDRYFPIYKIEPIAQPSERQQEAFRQWLGCDLIVDV
ncbi:hypothetical protein C900_04941 [Fulvivirga imtechensis AK7]|uniref:PDZ domain-containing protein n=1 Tax=Fulvivirga imtechensis AK7 TaxID=1237149 RepID=L8JMT5_9BACT|nr:M61 family metallopeptidase [Fulvivirga imtechensis]ELR69553.1 hypothetical protein C900_04941 [Fulvivirga imtechensis AK7]